MAQSNVLNYLLTVLKSSSSVPPSDVIDLLGAATCHLGFLSSSKQPTDEDDAELRSELLQKINNLASSKSQVSNHHGLRLLTIVAAVCSGDLFLANYQDWATHALSSIKSDATSPGWNLLATVFTRIKGFLPLPGVRRDASALVPKLVSVVNRYATTQDESVAVPWDMVLHALQETMQSLPAAFRQHTNALQPIIVNFALGSITDERVRELSAQCLVSLPRAAGDAESWSSTAQRLLTTAHSLLDRLLMGMEDQELVQACRQSVDPSAAHFTSTAQHTSTTIDALGDYKHYFTQVHTILHCLDLLLTRSYPSSVPLPANGIVMLATRIVTFDDTTASSHATSVGASAGKLAHLWTKLPSLHRHMLAVLREMLFTAGSHVFVSIGPVCRLLMSRLGVVAAGLGSGAVGFDSGCREQLYKCCEAVLQVGGIAASRYIAPSLILALEHELYSSRKSTPHQHEAGFDQQPPRKKAKKGTGGSSTHADAEHLQSAFLQHSHASTTFTGDFATVGALSTVHAQVAAVRCLENLVTASSGTLTVEHRNKCNDIAAHIAAAAAQLAEKHSRDGDGDNLVVVKLQLATYKALLSSILAPMLCRPTHIAAAVKLFTGGLSSSCADLAAFCSQAFLCIETFLHPRAPPIPGVLPHARASQETNIATNTIRQIPQFFSVLDIDATMHVQALQVVKEFKNFEDRTKQLHQELQLHIEAAKHQTAGSGGAQSRRQQTDGVATKTAAGAPPQQKQHTVPVMATTALIGNKQYQSTVSPVNPVGNTHKADNITTGSGGVHLAAATGIEAATAAADVGSLAALQGQIGGDDLNGGDDSDGPLPEIDSGESSDEDSG